MLLQGVCLAVLVAFQLAKGIPLKDEKVEPVELSHFCTITVNKGEDHNKTPIVLIHGLSVSADNWDGVWEVLALQTGRRVCAVDLRNHGDSPWNNRTDITALTADIDHFLKTQNIQKVNLIGHSLGGKVSIHYALNNPGKVNSVVIEDMRPNSISKEALILVSGVMQMLKAALNTVPDGSTEDEARKIIADFLSAKMKELDPNLEIDGPTAFNFPIKCEEGGKCQYKMNIDLFEKALENPDELFTTSSGLYEGPALFIYGMDSVFDVAGDKENILKLFPNAKLFGVKGAGHIIHALFREFNDQVIRFLKDLE